MSTLKVLVVDDDAQWRELVGKLCEHNGMAVTLAASGQEALDMISKDLPDIMVTDLEMPKMNGVELVRIIRLLRYDFPIIFISGNLSILKEWSPVFTTLKGIPIEKPPKPTVLFESIRTLTKANATKPVA